MRKPISLEKNTKVCNKKTDRIISGKFNIIAVAHCRLLTCVIHCKLFLILG